MNFLTKKYNARQLGSIAENRACEFLLKRGLKLLQRNYYCKLGEIDLVMKDKEEFVFVEVRYRKVADFGGGLESITFHKQKKLIKASLHYLMVHKLLSSPCRFDAVAIAKRESDIVWIKNAFQADSL